MAVKVICRNCKYFRQPSALNRRTQEVGECHRYPPQIIPKMEDMGRAQRKSFFTPVRINDWCGEWISKR